MTIFKRCLFVLLFSFSGFSLSAIEVVDFKNRLVKLEKPAKRIIALAPHIVENLYAAGAGDFIVGAVEHSDYPPEASKIPRVGAISQYSLEAIVELKPDLVVVYGTGRGLNVLSKLETLGLKAYVSNPQALEDIARSIRDYGLLTAQQTTAEQAAKRFEMRYQALKQRYGAAKIAAKPKVFYQVWDAPIQTLNDENVISDVIRLCGGVNAFGDSPAIAPKVSVESLIATNPDVIIASGMGVERPDWLDDWKKWTHLKAVKQEHLYFIPPDIIQRHTPRILEGATLMCEQLEKSRKTYQDGRKGSR